jgi:hypothetical protein
VSLVLEARARDGHATASSAATMTTQPLRFMRPAFAKRVPHKKGGESGMISRVIGLGDAGA